MKWFLLSILAPALLLSCKQEGPKETQRTSQKLQLSLSAGFSSDQQALSMDYRLESNKVKAILEGKTKVPVRTYIYQGSSTTPIGNQLLDWTVQKDMKTLRYEGSINLSSLAATTTELRLVAVIGEATQGVENELIVSTSYSQGATIKLLSPTESTTINVPYILETKLDKNSQGLWKVRGTDRKIFRPYGHLLRVNISNNAFADVTITGISSNRLLAKSSKLNVYPEGSKTLSREEELSPINLKFSEEIKIGPKQYAEKDFLLWIPRINDLKTYHLDLMVKEIPSSRLYTVIKTTKQPSDLKDGKIYNVTLELHRTIVNPLSLLSDDVMNRGGTDFVDLRNTFKIDQLLTYNIGPNKVGYFGLNEAIDKFCNEQTFPSTGTTWWHLPDFFEWYSIFYNPEYDVKKGYKDVRKETQYVKVGVGSKSSDGNPTDYYWRTISYEVHVPQEAMGTYNSDTENNIPTIKTNYSYYILSFAKANASDSKDSRFPPETTDNNRFAFRYTLKDDRILITCVPVGVQEMTVKELADPNNPIFSGINAVNRTIPFYGISNEPPYTQRDILKGNRRIIDYATNTRDLSATPTVAAFSAPRNRVLPYSAPHRFPVALFKRVTER